MERISRQWVGMRISGRDTKVVRGNISWLSIVAEACEETWKWIFIQLHLEEYQDADQQPKCITTNSSQSGAYCSGCQRLSKGEDVECELYECRAAGYLIRQISGYGKAVVWGYKDASLWREVHKNLSTWPGWYYFRLNWRYWLTFLLHLAQRFKSLKSENVSIVIIKATQIKLKAFKRQLMEKSVTVK